MDTTDPEIRFDEMGACTHCRSAEKLLSQPPYCLTSEQKKIEFEKLVTTVREEGKGKRYDCIIGLSGGVDSSYTAYLVRRAGLRPLAVHLDNGWDAELAVDNIRNICEKLKIDLFTFVLDWEEFKDLQLSFLRASTPDSEFPSDHAIQALMMKTAVRERTRFVLAGTNLASESILPRAWSRGDWRYIKSIHERFGTRKSRSFPHFTLFDSFVFQGLWRLKWVNTLDYFEYNRNEAKKIIQRELGWRDYGLKHHESLYTKFFQAYILPKKFGYDKRKAHLSSLICAGQMSRDQALQEMTKELYPPNSLEEDMNYAISKLGLTRDEFNEIMARPKRTYMDYPNYENSVLYALIRRFLPFISTPFHVIDRAARGFL
jgi:N-acetyl sugar amidotransferase